jgi:antitoxin component YwqK of YwqJK toxin-antitoxin module
MKAINIMAIFLLVSVFTVGQNINNTKELAYDDKGELLNGKYVQKSETDQTTKVFFYENGVLSGDFMIYASNGNLLEKGQYLDGYKNGTWMNWTISGIKTGEVSFSKGQKEGKWQIWDEKGTLRYVMFYEAGEKVGNWKIFAENGSLLQEKEYTRTL